MKREELLGRPTLVGEPLSGLGLNQSTVLSSRAVDGHQMYFGGSVVCKASTVGIEISPTSPLNFIGGQKVRNLASFATSLNFEPSAFENAPRYPTSETKVQCCDDRRRPIGPCQVW